MTADSDSVSDSDSGRSNSIRLGRATLSWPGFRQAELNHVLPRDESGPLELRASRPGPATPSSTPSSSLTRSNHARRHPLGSSVCLYIVRPRPALPFSSNINSPQAATPSQQYLPGLHYRRSRLGAISSRIPNPSQPHPPPNPSLRSNPRLPPHHIPHNVVGTYSTKGRRRRGSFCLRGRGQ